MVEFKGKCQIPLFTINDLIEEQAIELFDQEQRILINSKYIGFPKLDQLKVNESFELINFFSNDDIRN